MAVSSFRVGGRRFCKDESVADGCFFSSRHCRNGSGNVFSNNVLLLSSSDGSEGCNGGERVGLVNENRAGRNEVENVFMF
jgi:hypothetical protein